MRNIHIILEQHQLIVSNMISIVNDNSFLLVINRKSFLQSNIDQIILSGSGTRVPKVQQVLLEYVNKKELGKSLNTDESAALGAAYQAAHLSKGFKVKTFLIKDANIYPVQVSVHCVSFSNFSSLDYILSLLLCATFLVWWLVFLTVAQLGPGLNP